MINRVVWFMSRAVATREEAVRLTRLGEELMFIGNGFGRYRLVLAGPNLDLVKIFQDVDKGAMGDFAEAYDGDRLVFRILNEVSGVRLVFCE